MCVGVWLGCIQCSALHGVGWLHTKFVCGARSSISFFVLQTMEDSGSLVHEMLDGRMSAEPSDPLAENHSNEMLTEPTDFCQPAQPEGKESQDGHPGGPVAPLLTITLEEGVGICLLCEQTHEDLRLLLACIKQKHMVYFRIGESS